METSKFVKQLGSNNRKTRENAIETLEKFIQTKEFQKSKQVQYDKLWKGLYFAMWFSDRPRPQQRLANKLAELHLLFFVESQDDEKLTLNEEAFIKFSKAFWRVLIMEWMNIDRWRLDKYLLLVRRAFFNQLRYLSKSRWKAILFDRYYEKVLRKLVFSGDPRVYNGVPFHVIDILLDEWARLYKEEVESTDLDDSKVGQYLQTTPFLRVVGILIDLTKDVQKSKVLKDKIKQDLFEDDRLKQWGIDLPIMKAGVDVSESADDDEEDADDDEEWQGFQ